MATMKIAVMRLRLILLSAYAINQPHSLSSSSLGDLLATTTRLIPNGSIRYAMYQHIMAEAGSSIVRLRTTQSSCIGKPYAAKTAEIRRSSR
jgi:hypothetical protein